MFEGIPIQENKFELTLEQRAVSVDLNSEMEDAIMALDTSSDDDKKRIDDFLEARIKFQEELEEQDIGYHHLHLWHVLAGGTISDAAKIRGFDTPDGRIEKFLREKLIPLIKKGE